MMMGPEQVFLAILLASLLGFGGLGSLPVLRSQLSAAGLAPDGVILPALAVGNITDADQINSILLAGRADLVCLARPHLADPYWTLHAAADQRYTGATWPKPYLAGRDQLYRLRARTEQPMQVKV